MSLPPHKVPGPLYKPFEKLVRINVLDTDFDVPEGNMLLRAFQYLSPENVAMGRFCWNEECQYCRVSFQEGDAAPRQALSCKLMVRDGLKITEINAEIRYCLREVLGKK